MVKILLVEDEPAHIELIKRAFQDRIPPVDLVIANSIQQARTHLDALISSGLDMVITDWLLPDGHGIEILEYLQDPPCPVPAPMPRRIF